MMTGRWNLRLDRFRNRMGEAVKQKAERVTQTLVDKFVRDSPVYTGQFRGSWNVSEAKPVFIRAEGGTPNSPLGMPSIRVKATTQFPVFYITNGQPYGQKLEYGSSDQAPHGIVRVNIASMR